MSEIRKFVVTLMFLDSPPHSLTLDAESLAHCLSYVAEVVLADVTRRVVQVEVTEVAREDVQLCG